eukprot:TRINITY_DN27183_c0_g1_i1.p1 TRINITY_DN27183_c0_g1~~TRINITY_DN27183_c0_g1_i1.p1  ORF type:complete len:105 (-),score=10.82 TRINITY_DN27183_c0_g1_i1:412-726(-)
MVNRWKPTLVRNVVAMEGWPGERLCCHKSYILGHFMFAPTFSEFDPPLALKTRTFELSVADFESNHLQPSKEDEEPFWISYIWERLESFNALMFGWTSAFVLVH